MMSLNPKADGPFAWLSQDSTGDYFISCYVELTDLSFCDITGVTTSNYPTLLIPFNPAYYPLGFPVDRQYGYIFVTETLIANNVTGVTGSSVKVTFKNASGGNVKKLEVHILKVTPANGGTPATFKLIGKVDVNKDDADSIAGGGGGGLTVAF